MALVNNRFTSGITDYFANYIPYQLGMGEVAIDNISDMYSINIFPSDSVIRINQPIGSQNTFTFTFRIKNLTKNTNLEVELIFKENIITCDERIFIVNPEETKTVEIFVDKSEADGVNSLSTIREQMQVIIKNIKTDELSIRRSSTNELDEIILPDEVTVE
jgi:hypothetical protein